VLRRPGVRYSLALSSLFLVSLGLRIYAATALHFDGLYGQDAYAYFQYGQRLQDTFTRFRLPPGPFYFPLGYPILAALGLMILGAAGPQIVSLCAGAGVAVLALAITVEAAPLVGISRKWTAGVIAWAVVTVCGQLIQSSIVVMSDTSALLWASLSALALLRFDRTRRLRWLVLTGFALGWATMTRWQYGGLALIWGLYLARSWRPVMFAGLVMLVTLLPQLACTLLNPQMVSNQPILEHWSLTNFFARDFTTADGTFHYDSSPAVYYAQPLYNPYYMSPLFLLFLVPGLIYLSRRRGLFLLLVGWFAVEYGLLAGGSLENIRFALAIVPPLAVVIGLGFAAIRWRVLQIPLALLVCYGLMQTLHASIPVITDFVAVKNRDLDAARWIAAQVPEPEARIYNLDLFLTIEHYTSLRPVQIYQLTPQELSQQLADAQPAYAVFNSWTTERQWYGKSPWIVYHWLEDNPGLTEIGSFSIYTLYRIGR
jgi:hypothetical protein